ncbi:conjugal transfer protein TraA [Rhodococcus erythropolis]|nr:conjugal transfer protein TraA [Rhodococcus erythropolis]
MVEMMTIHKLQAGDGYVYLTKHVANGDATESRKKDAVDYYNAKGTPAGQWWGKAAARVGVSVGDEVTERGMRSTFGRARTPDAEATMPARNAPFSEMAEWSARTALGRPFSNFSSHDYIEEVEERCSAYKQVRGEYPETDVKNGIKFDVALLHLKRAKGDRAALFSDAEVMTFVADSYRKMRQPVAGYDLVFTPMKSISLLWALGDPRVKAAVEEAHRQAVDEILGYIEDELTYTRRGEDGVRQIKAEGLLVARFDHWDNRAGDPNLHTHCAVLNRVYAEEKWTTIDGRVFYRAAVSASERYNTRVADLVSRNLGVSFAPRADTPVGKQPVYEVEGIPLTLIEEFSRRQAIVDRQEELAAEYATRFGRNPPKKVQYAQAQQATLDTRNAKNPPRSMDELRAEWDERARAIVVDVAPNELIAGTQTGRDNRPVFGPDDLENLVRNVADDLSRKVGHWTIYTLRAEVERSVRAFSFADESAVSSYVDAATSELVANHCVPTFTEVYTAPEQLSECIEGGLVRLHQIERTTMRYTSETVLAAEKFMRAKADTVNERTVDARIIRRQIRKVEKAVRKEKKLTSFQLGDDQVAMIEHFLTAGKDVAVAVGAAGAGKTTAATVIARAWEQTNGKVVALGPSARAAEVLGEEISVEGRTIADVLTRARHHIPTGIESGDLLLVDEAGMASARDLADLTRIATGAGAVVRLLGDHQQLASVESGGVLRDLAERTDAPFLSKVHRFKTEGEAAASLTLRQGEATSLNWYESHNRIVDAMKHELPDKVFASYVTDIENDQEALMVAPTNDLVRELNVKAAAYYRANGTVTGTGIVLADGLEAAVGDIVVTRKNNSKYMAKDSDGKTTGRVKNGDLWNVVEVGVDGSLRIENRTSGGRVVVAADYITDNVQLGYAATVHRSQGMTVGTCHVLTDSGMDRQGFYVAMTRGKNANIAYAANDELPDWDFEHLPDDHPGARGVLEGIIARDGSQRTAHQLIEEEKTRAGSFEAIKTSYMAAVNALYEEYTADLLGEILPDEQFTWVHTFGGFDQIVGSVMQAETFGWDTRRLLVDAANIMRTEGGAGNVDFEDNTPGKIMARTLKAATAPEKLPRRRRDFTAQYNIPHLSDAAAERDTILTAYARSHERQMHGFVEQYIRSAIKARAPWVVALGKPGTDPRKQTLFRATAREVAISRIAAHANDTDTDPLTFLRPMRADAVTAAIGQITTAPKAESVYASFTADELATEAASAKRRIADARLRLAHAKMDLARTTGDSEVDGVAAAEAKNEADAARIREAKNARALFEQIRLSPHATTEQVERARTLKDAAEAGAPEEIMWGVIERSAEFNRSQRSRRSERAEERDELVIGRLTAHIERLEKTVGTDVERLTLLEEELRTRTGTNEPAPRRRPTTSTESEDEYPLDPTVYEQGNDRGPEL